jgi:N-acyl-D-aspartate/D-glutamate deacylase
MVIRTVLLSCLAAIPASPIAAQVADVLIVGGTIHDGTGRPGWTGAVAIHGDRIVHVGEGTSWTARDTIDARGQIIAPGFIDPHVHASDLSIADPETRRAAFALMQGVTTLLTGNDGGGSFEVERTQERFTEGGIGVNAGVLVGHGAVRGGVLGSADRAPTAIELDSMRVLVDRAMREGAFGLSTGLYYAPGNFATTDEVIALARVAARHGGIYESHIRDESSYTIGLRAAVQEVLDIGRAAAIPVHISHIKALGVDVWGSAPEIIAMVRAAQADGLRVTADQYPWTASGTGLHSALLPRWAEAGGRQAMLERLADPATRLRITTEMTENLRRRGGPASLLLHSISGPADLREAASGVTLEVFAARRGVAPVEAALELITAGRASVASFNMREDDIEAFMREPWVMTGSDGSGGHPRKYATYPRKLRRYVLDQPVLPMERMVQASSAQVAETFGIAERGQLREGWYADVIVFDPAAVREVATYAEPNQLAEGMAWVFVNGVAVVAEGVVRDLLPGRALRRN